jgi:uncharacterized protein DUF3185
MNSQRIIGLALLVVGVVLLLFGLNASDSFNDSVKEGLTGRYTDKTMWYIVGGAGTAALGAALTFFGGRRLRSA